MEKSIKLLLAFQVRVRGRKAEKAHRLMFTKPLCTQAQLKPVVIFLACVVLRLSVAQKILQSGLTFDAHCQAATAYLLVLLRGLAVCAERGYLRVSAARFVDQKTSMRSVERPKTKKSARVIDMFMPGSSLLHYTETNRSACDSTRTSSSHSIGQLNDM